eukprot:12897544-Prorocentrum_lima.AAC.1
MVEQFGQKRHHIVFGGVAEMWGVEPGTFNRRCEQVLDKGRQLGLHMIDGSKWMEETKEHWIGMASIATIDFSLR